MEVTQSLECAAAVTCLWQYENVTVSWSWREQRCSSGIMRQSAAMEANI